MSELTPEQAANVDRNLAAVNAEIDQMIVYWRIISTHRSKHDAVLDMSDAFRRSRPTEDDQTRLIVVMVSRLAGRPVGPDYE